MIEPHSGRLVDRVVSDEHAAQLRQDVADTAEISLTTAQFQELINIATGRFSPLTGFLSQNDFHKVVYDMTLEDGTTWSLPVTLDVDASTAETLDPDRKVGLRHPDGSLVGALAVADVYRYNKQETAAAIYGTSDPDHPGVSAYRSQGDFLIGGDVFVFETPRYNDFDLLPAETRVLFGKQGWDCVVGFQTRNAPHRAHEYIQKVGLEQADGLLVQPKLGFKKGGDYQDEVIMGAYRRLFDEYYPRRRVALSVFPSKMRYAGPREAVFDAIVRKNQGCTHFIVGRDHAGVEDYYDGFEAHRIFDEIGDIGVEPLFFSHAFYCERCDGMASDRICAHGDEDRVYPSGTEIRTLIEASDQPSPKMMRPEVSEYLLSRTQPFVPTADAEAGGTEAPR